MADSLNLRKIIIITECKLEDKELLDSVAIYMEGARVDSVLYTHISTNEVDEDELISELYDDCYEEDELDFEVEPVSSGRDVIEAVSDFVVDNWDGETMILYYQADSDMFEELSKLLNEEDGAMVLTDYHDIFTNGRHIDRDVYQTMEALGINTSMMLEDSLISRAYFLGMLVDRLFDR